MNYLVTILAPGYRFHQSYARIADAMVAVEAALAKHPTARCEIRGAAMPVAGPPRPTGVRTATAAEILMNKRRA